GVDSKTTTRIFSKELPRHNTQERKGTHPHHPLYSQVERTHRTHKEPFATEFLVSHVRGTTEITILPLPSEGQRRAVASDPACPLRSNARQSCHQRYARWRFLWP